MTKISEYVKKKEKKKSKNWYNWTFSKKIKKGKSDEINSAITRNPKYIKEYPTEY